LLAKSMPKVIAIFPQKLTHRLGPRFSDDWREPQLRSGLLEGFLQDNWAIVLKSTHCLSEKALETGGERRSIGGLIGSAPV
jgi:hypothetical protein